MRHNETFERLEIRSPKQTYKSLSLKALEPTIRCRSKSASSYRQKLSNKQQPKYIESQGEPRQQAFRSDKKLSLYILGLNDERVAVIGLHTNHLSKQRPREYHYVRAT